MFFSLAGFYSSTVWRKFRSYLINERTNKKDGILYSEYSKTPIISSFDIVLHHKTPLNEKNVNDAAISLNPDNILICTRKEHNEIHSRFGYCTQRKVYLVYGAPCSGKSTYINSIRGNSDIIVDIDRIWEALTGSPYKKPPALRPIVFDLYFKALDNIRTRAGQWENAYIVTGMPLKFERERFIYEYDAETIFIDVDKDTCLKRLMNDKDKDPQEWQKYIEKWFNDYQE